MAGTSSHSSRPISPSPEGGKACGQKGSTFKGKICCYCKSCKVKAQKLYNQAKCKLSSLYNQRYFWWFAVPIIFIIISLFVPDVETIQAFKTVQQTEVVVDEKKEEIIEEKQEETGEQQVEGEPEEQNEEEVQEQEASEEKPAEQEEAEPVNEVQDNQEQTEIVTEAQEQAEPAAN